MLVLLNGLLYQEEDSDGDVFTTHAPLGQRVIVGVGATIGAGIGYTGNPPSGAIFQVIVVLMILQSLMQKLK